MSYSIPYSFIPGTKARAQEVNANFNALNTNLDLLDTKKANTDFSNLSSEAISVIKNNSSLRNIGELIFSPIPLNDFGIHLLDGSKIQKEGIYENFVEFVEALYNENPLGNYFTTEAQWQQSVTTYGECGKFVYDGVNNTVRLPKISGIIEGTDDLSVLGNLVEAGLPNITGGTTMTGLGIEGYGASFSGAFSSSASGYDNPMQGGWDNTAGFFNGHLNFNASKSSPIYGKSSTVQPQTIKYFIYIVIANIAKTDIQVDIDNIATDLNGKADTDLTNVTNAGFIKMAGASMPRGRYIDLTVGANGSTYTAPANGWFCFDSWVSGYYIYLHGTVLRQVAQKGSSTGVDMSGYIPATKGQTVTLGYEGTWQPHSWQSHPFCFVYAQGSESEAS